MNEQQTKSKLNECVGEIQQITDALNIVLPRGCKEDHALVQTSELIHDTLLSQNTYREPHSQLDRSPFLVEACIQLVILFRTMLCIRPFLDACVVASPSISAILPSGTEPLVPQNKHFRAWRSQINMSDATPVENGGVAMGSDLEWSIPRTQDTLNRLKYVARSVYGSVCLCEAYRVASKYGAQSLRRQYKRRMKLQFQNVSKRMDVLLVRNPTESSLARELDVSLYGNRSLIGNAVSFGICDVTGHELVSSYVHQRFVTDTERPLRESKDDILTDLIRERKLPSTTSTIQHMAIEGGRVFFQNPRLQLCSPWLLYLFDLFLNGSIAYIFAWLSWGDASIRNGVATGILLIYTLLFGWPTHQRAKLPIINSIYKISVLLSILACISNIILWVPNLVQKEMFSALEHVFFVGTGLMHGISLGKYPLVLKGVGHMVLILSRAVKRVAYLSIMCFFLILCFASSMHAIALQLDNEHSDYGTENISLERRLFRSGLGRSALALSNMFLDQPNAILYAANTDFSGGSENVYAIGLTTLLYSFSITTYLFILNLFIAIITSAYDPEETGRLFHATKSTLEYEYIMYARKKRIPSAPGSVLFLLKYIFPEKITQMVSRIILSITIVPVLSIAWTLVSVFVFIHTMSYHMYLTLFDSRPYNLRKRELFVYFEPLARFINQRHMFSNIVVAPIIVMIISLTSLPICTLVLVSAPIIVIINSLWYAIQ